MSNSEKEHDFALEVIRRLRAAGHEALLAGGCVRDLLLGRSPGDFDVATGALPDQVRALFGHRRTLAVGQAFGVIVVLGRARVSVEVATFRKDLSYSDGRRPDSVRFCDAREDAMRRDFTINGLFYDPATEEVVDYVDGQRDLDGRMIRAIGDAHERFAEDKLRILRAIRFATVLDFDIDAATWDAVRSRSEEIRIVSAERVSAELRKTLQSRQRGRGTRLLCASGLLQQLLPELPVKPDSTEVPDTLVEQLATAIASLEQTDFAAVLALLMRHTESGSEARIKQAATVARRWRLTNLETETTKWLLQHEDTVLQAHTKSWPQLQRVLVHAHGPLLVDYAEAVCRSLGLDTEGIEFCRQRLVWPAEQLNPPALIDGDQLKAAGITPGPVFRRLLNEVRDAQLMGRVNSTEDAIQLALELAAKTE